MDIILARLREQIASQYLKIKAADLPEDQPLVSTGLIDSISLVDLALFIEATFGVRVEDTELNASTFDTLLDLASLVASRR
jgi:acyl carrier protein